MDRVEVLPPPGDWVELAGRVEGVAGGGTQTHTHTNKQHKHDTHTHMHDLTWEEEGGGGLRIGLLTTQSSNMVFDNGSLEIKGGWEEEGVMRH